MTKKEIKYLWDKHRIPCKDDKCYIVRLAEESMFPTSEEIGVILSYRKYVVEDFYRMPLDEFFQKYEYTAIGGHNTVTFTKMCRNWLLEEDDIEIEGWAYRRMTWNTGPYYFPPLNIEHSRPVPWNLVEVLDHMNKFGDEPNKSWELWKSYNRIHLSSATVRLNAVQRCPHQTVKKGRKIRRVPKRLQVLLKGSVV